MAFFAANHSEWLADSIPLALRNRYGGEGLVLFAIVIAEPLPEGEPEGEPETGAEPEAGANAEPEKNSVSLAQAHIFTAFVSFIAFVLLKWIY